MTRSAEKWCVSLPLWPTQRLLRQQRRAEISSGTPRAQTPTPPQLLTTILHDRTIVDACCHRAIAQGIRPGMTLADARSMSSTSPVITPHDHAADREGLIRLARWLDRYIPQIAIDDALQDQHISSSAASSAALLMDASGCDKLYGSMHNLLKLLRHHFRRFQLTAHIAAAPTFGAAWALAHYGPQPKTPSRSKLQHLVGRSHLVGPDELAKHLDPLPIAALRLHEATLTQLSAVGIETIGHLRGLPRKSIASRYPAEVLLRLDQAFGQAMERIEPIRVARPFVIEQMLDGPTDRIEGITQLTRDLLERLCEQLAQASKGSLSLQVELVRSDLPRLAMAVRTSLPTCDGPHLWKLLAPKLEQAHLGFGVEGVRLMVLRSRRLIEQQGTYIDGVSQASLHEQGRLLDTLAARLGEARVLKIVERKVHHPERGFVLQSALRQMGAASGVKAIAKREKPSKARDDPQVDLWRPAMHTRPTVLFPRAMGIEVMSLVPDGPVFRIVHQQQVHEVMASSFPERIAGAWWRSTGERLREYYRVVLASGEHWWVYRVRENEEGGVRWFVQGKW
jgi:protein ImuB